MFHGIWLRYGLPNATVAVNHIELSNNFLYTCYRMWSILTLFYNSFILL